ncbi:MAG TPA: HupE/UreJ family protein [Blastocatellia bacterium]|nr:HupE/UreJ family protein [Blastocatellia bacterium]
MTFCTQASKQMRGTVRRVLLVFPLVLALPALARSHDAMSSWAVAKLRPKGLELRVTLGVEAVQLLMDKPAGPIDDSTPALLQQLKTRARSLYQVYAGGAALTARSVDVTVEEVDGVDVLLVYPRPRTSPLRFEASYLSKLPKGHRTSLVLVNESDQILWSQLPTATNPTVEMVLPPELLALSTGDEQPASRDSGHGTVEPAKPAGSQLEPGDTTATESSADVEKRPDDVAAAAGPLHQPSFWEFLQLGIEHILTGYDHLLFLFGLLVACRSFKSIAAIITCFTLAHSLTLALAALGLVTVSGRIVEPLIAVTIVFVGVENLIRREEPKGRWALTFFFGLIHGFGFAGVLKQIGLGPSGAAMAMPLFAFNFGVEIGQLAVTALVLPLLWKLGNIPRFARQGRLAISGVVALVGVYWLAQRMLF